MLSTSISSKCCNGQKVTFSGSVSLRFSIQQPPLQPIHCSRESSQWLLMISPLSYSLDRETGWDRELSFQSFCYANGFDNFVKKQNRNINNDVQLGIVFTWQEETSSVYFHFSRFCSNDYPDTFLYDLTSKNGIQENVCSMSVKEMNMRTFGCELQHIPPFQFLTVLCPTIKHACLSPIKSKYVISAGTWDSIPKLPSDS